MGDDLVEMKDFDQLVNEDIILEDTGINLREIDKQTMFDRIKCLEEEVYSMGKCK